MNPNLKSYILLKDGTMLESTSKQRDSLTMAILMSKDLTQKVKLGGRVFRLNEIEEDAEKILKAKRSSMNFENKS